jgi:hypothetical protein
MSVSNPSGGPAEPKKFTPRFIAPRGGRTTGATAMVTLPGATESEERKAKVDISKVQ